MMALDTGLPAQLAVALASTLVLAAILLFARWLTRRLGLGPEVSRKTVHVAVGLYAMTFPLVFRAPLTVLLIVLGSTALLIALRISARRPGSLGGPLHGVARHSWGDILFGVSVAFLFFRSGGETILYSLPIGVLTLADAAAALAGSAYGRRWLAREEGRKSLEGAATFFVVTWLVAMIALLLLSETGRGMVVALGFAVAVLATLIEADSWHGFDNLFVPVGVHLMLQALLGATPATALAVAAVVLATWLLAYRLGPRLGMSPQAACASALIIIVLAITTSLHNLLLPVLALAAHRLAMAADPPHDTLADLDFVTVLALLSLGWLTLGLSMGINAIGFFEATMLGLVALLAAVSSRAMPGASAALLGAAIVAAGLAAVLNRSVTPPAIAAIAATLVVAIGLLAGRRAAIVFRYGRATKAGALAASVPLTLYLHIASVLP